MFIYLPKIDTGTYMKPRDLLCLRAVGCCKAPEVQGLAHGQNEVQFLDWDVQHVNWGGTFWVC